MIFLAALGAAGLVASVRITPLGVEVATWARAHTAAAPLRRPLPGCGTGALRRSAHEPEERAAMAERARAALAGVAAEGPDLVELGDPEAGYSYRLARRAEVLGWFLRALGEAPSAAEPEEVTA